MKVYILLIKEIQIQREKRGRGDGLRFELQCIIIMKITGTKKIYRKI